jgi:hypothetical protein
MIPSPVVDTILPPSLAYEIGRDAEKRAADVREGRATQEGRFVELPGRWTQTILRPEDFLGWEEPALSLTEKHPKRHGGVPSPVADLVRRPR